MKKSIAFLALCLILTLLIVPLTVSALSNEDENTVTILFTHDLHSHFLPQVTADPVQTGISHHVADSQYLKFHTFSSGVYFLPLYNSFPVCASLRPSLDKAFSVLV